MIMKFYMTPGSCSTGIHILLEELGLVFEAYLVNLLANDHAQDQFLQINPKGTIPVLVREDGSALSDFQAIAWWLARQHPRAGLLPVSIEDEVRVLDIMNYVINTIHMQGFARIFTTEKFTPHESDHDRVRQQGKEIIGKGFTVISGMLDGQGYVTDTLSIADAALFYIEFWADKSGIDMPVACQNHYRKMLELSSVRRVLREEGYRV